MTLLPEGRSMLAFRASLTFTLTKLLLVICGNFFSIASSSPKIYTHQCRKKQQGEKQQKLRLLTSNRGDK